MTPFALCLYTSFILWRWFEDRKAARERRALEQSVEEIKAALLQSPLIQYKP